MQRTLYHAAFLICLIGFSPTAGALPAFPGAEGWGSDTPGGRGGRVIAVTNLNDSGPGSFREACEADGARIVVFRVGGTIELESAITIENPYVTIAGQTAPGGGICLKNAPFRIVTHDVVVRFIRVRIGASRVEEVNRMDTIWVGGDTGNAAHDVIVDHCSFSWSQDEVASAVNGASNVIYSWCVISEGLREPFPGEGGEDGGDRKHAYAVMIGNNPNRVSFHHNFVSNCDHRNPRIQGGTHQIVNNVFYNWGYLTGTFSRNPNVNLINNFYKPGPSSRRLLPVTEKAEDLGRVYASGNLSPFRPNNSLPDWENTLNAPAEGHKADAPFPADPITTTDAWQAYWEVLAGAGATLPKRDAVDERLIQEAKSGGGRIIDRPDEVGGYPDLAGGTAPDDTDMDGMPDEWEKEHGLNPNDASDAAAPDAGGYTHIESYLNSVAAEAPRFDPGQSVIPKTSAFSAVVPPEPPPLIKSQGKPVFPIAMRSLSIKTSGPDLPGARINCWVNGFAPDGRGLAGIESRYDFCLIRPGDRMIVRRGDEAAMNAWAKEIERIVAIKECPSLLGVIGPDSVIGRVAQKHSLSEELYTSAWPDAARVDLAREIEGVWSGRRMLEISAGESAPLWLNLGARTNPVDVARLLNPPCVDIAGFEVADLVVLDEWPRAIMDRAGSLVKAMDGRPIYAALEVADLERAPVETVIKTMAFSAIAGGARGIHWLNDGAGRKLWAGIESTSREMDRFAPFLLEGTPMPVRSGDTRIMVCGWACAGNRQAVLAINTTGEAIPQGRISLEGSWTGQNAYVLSTGEKLKLLADPAGCVDVALEAYESVVITNDSVIVSGGN